MHDLRLPLAAPLLCLLACAGEPDAARDAPAPHASVYATEATRPRPPGPAIVDLTATTPPQADATPDPIALVPGDPPPDPGRRGIAGRSIRVPTVRPGRAEILGGLDPELVRRVVRSHLRELRRCYDRGLARDRDLAGRVAVGLVIATNGQVSATSVQEDTLRDGLVAPCIAAAARRWRFPKPRSCGVVTVVYPFVLQPG